MDSGAIFFCVLLLLLINIHYSFSAEEQNVSISIRTDTSIASVDNSFICATIDWWPKEKCNYNSCPWANSSLQTMDLKNPVLYKALKAFQRLRIRIGGSLQDQVIYNAGNNVPICDGFRFQVGALFNFTEGCLSMCRWDELNNFLSKTGVAVTFGLNALIGRRKGPDTLYVGDWDHRNAQEFISYTASKGYKLDSWEFGNELSGSGVRARVEAKQYGKDLIRLRKIVDQVYQNSSHKPKVLAPGGFYDKQWFDEMLQTSGAGVVDGLTHHMYNLGSGNDPELINKMQDPHTLDRIAQTYRDVEVSIKNFGPWSSAWVGESGGAYNSGGFNLSNTFVDSFWYLDQLGMASTFDHKVYCRQALVGGFYGLLDTNTFHPNPDYYSALLWSRLMGTEVLRTTINGSPYLRAYTHCSKNQDGVTVLLINLSNCTAFNVSVTSDPNLHPRHDTKIEGAEARREEYHLRPKDGDLRSRIMLLNGQPLTLTRTGDIPALKPIYNSANSKLKISPLSVAFVRLKDFIAPACW